MSYVLLSFIENNFLKNLIFFVIQMEYLTLGFKQKKKYQCRCHLGFWPFLEWPYNLCQKLQHVSFAFFCEPNAFSPPLNFLPYTRLKFAPVSNIARNLWRGASKHSLNTLDAIQRRAIRLIGDPALTDTLDDLAHRRSVSALFVFYRYYHGFCPE